MSEEAIYFQHGYMAARKGEGPEDLSGVSEPCCAEYRRGYKRGLEHKKYRLDRRMPEAPWPEGLEK